MLFYHKTMTLNPRQSALLEQVRSQGSASIEELARAFDVTLQTVRRDVNLLAEAGMLSRFHGGVRSEPSTIENITYRQRQGLHAEGKRRIAEAVARQVPDGCSLLINIGTTTEAIARALLQHRGLRVITNNLHVADILSDNPDCEVIVAGGVVRSRDRGITGEATIDFIRQFKVDIGLIGISGIEADGTLRDYDFREVLVARTIIEQSREVWLAADSSKFQRQAMVELAPISRISRFFTDAEPAPQLAQVLHDAGVHVSVS
ncbi:DeoR/GlpR transcriptional regulator [Bordetella avium]|nr:DeoR family transcriptional regulator [Bordetella avium]RIQ19146.1 DeoR/GlpR transcriptional regulator [Bordetella avium]RIQ32058.1 DeoR/GlpR transcriptional regulator [Bordetella avium]RIQ37993.1 DeoR/GlpR transcriptional regulator [Bordetella avium]RIQ41821.1 DeoR/GlpR transcriptional regulator [Bordetella avium]